MSQGLSPLLNPEQRIFSDASRKADKRSNMPMQKWLGHLLHVIAIIKAA